MTMAAAIAPCERNASKHGMKTIPTLERTNDHARQQDSEVRHG